MGKKDKKEQEEIVEKHEHHHDHEHGHCSCHEEEPCDCGGDCCCGGEESFEPPHLVRQFYTREEKITMLEDYLADLKAEVSGVEEELANLRKAA